MGDLKKICVNTGLQVGKFDRVTGHRSEADRLPGAQVDRLKTLFIQGSKH